MIVLILVLAGFILIASGVSRKRQNDRILDAILALELRLIDRERQAGLAANENARWQG